VHETSIPHVRISLEEVATEKAKRSDEATIAELLLNLASPQVTEV